MLLNEWIENRTNALLKSKVYKSVKFTSVSNVEIEKNMTSEIFDFNKKEISLNTNVEEFIRTELTTRIKGLKVTFEVTKPRCRKSQRLYLYVKLV